MGVVTGIVLYAIIWFMTLLVVLQTGVVWTHRIPVTNQVSRQRIDLFT